MRKLATAALSFSAAVFLAQYLMPSSWLVYCGAVTAFLSLSGFFFKAQARRRLFLIMISLAAGFLWYSGYSSVFYKPAELLDGKTEIVMAEVCGYPDVTDYGSKILVRVNTGSGRPVKTQLYIYESTPDLEPGKKITFTASFRSADTMYGEKTDSYLSRGVYLLATAKGRVTVIGESKSVFDIPVRTAHYISQMIDRVFSNDKSAFVRALILGDTSGVYRDTALSAALRTTGTSHIIAVSGMNIAFLMGFLGLFIHKKRLLTAVGIPVILIFMAVVGFMPPVVRAGVMQIFILIAPLFRRENDPVTSLSASLLLILLFNPYAAGSPGLQLSFTAILGIMLFTEKIFTAFDEPLRDRKIYKYVIGRKTIRFVIGSFSTTIGALVFSVPLIALHFGSVSLITPLTNLLIIWAVTLAFCVGIAAVVLGFIWLPLGSVAAYAAALPAGYVVKTIEFFSRMPFASVYTSNPAIVIWLVYIYLFVIIVLKMRLKLRQLLYPVCLSALTLCLILLCTSVFSDRRGLSVTALDVGQGQSIVVTSGRSTAVIDCGSSSGKDAGDLLTKYLQSRGRTSIDLLILTHYHTDHANGIAEVLERNRVSAVALPDPSIDSGDIPYEIRRLAEAKGISVIDVTENLQVMFDCAVITLFAPIGSDSENERGLSILCSENSYDALITGDMDAEIERRLVSIETLPDIELLIVGHHGSKSSTSDELLNATKPEAAVISVGYNRYGHPSPETLNKLASYGIAVYRTDEDGAVTVNGW